MAAILLFVLLSVIGVLCRFVVEQGADLRESQKQLIVCKEEAALTIEQMKNDQIAMLYRFQARQDTLEQGLMITKQKLTEIKRKMK